MMTLCNNYAEVFRGISVFFLHWFIQFTFYPRIFVFNSTAILMIADKRTLLSCENIPFFSYGVSVLIVLFITVTASAQVGPLDN